MDFEALAAEHNNAVYQLLLKLCHNREDAEDMLVEALQKAYQSQNELRHPEAFRVWLSQIARRIYWHSRRRDVLHPLQELDSGSLGTLQSSDPPPDVAILHEELRAIVEESLSMLPDTSRAAYRLHDIEDRPVKEVAALLGLSEANVKSRIHRARESVRHYLDAKFHPLGQPKT
ncbi:MAG: sigma-70 family RNA polymerase sigma factor [Acidobacteria bacterium]|nr:sigma-70 family RNA polymerase sigma factor [Acidobacteriota bacterium]